MSRIDFQVNRHSLPVADSPDTVLNQCRSDIFRNNKKAFSSKIDLSWKEFVNSNPYRFYERCIPRNVAAAFINQEWPFPTLLIPDTEETFLDVVTLVWHFKTYTATMIFTDDGECGVLVTEFDQKKSKS